ncbi:hypothetical protein EON65_30265 [archaeon]|nr:MAG: hypothetical protein EON65_30265 [archaeon]
MQEENCCCVYYSKLNKAHHSLSPKPRLLVILSGYIALEETETLLLILAKRYSLIVLCDSWSALLLARSKVSRLFIPLHRHDQTPTETDDYNKACPSLASALIRWSNAICVASMSNTLLTQQFLVDLQTPSSLVVQVIHQVSTSSKPRYYTCNLCQTLQTDTSVTLACKKWHKRGWIALLPDRLPVLDALKHKARMETKVTLSYIRLAMLQQDKDKEKSRRAVKKVLVYILYGIALSLFALCAIVAYGLMAMVLYPTPITY